MRVRIADRNADGRGRGSALGRTVLVSQAHPGEVVSVRSDLVTRGTIQGRVAALLEADPDRIAHDCHHEFHCTGCPLLAASPAAETEFKEGELKRVLAALPGSSAATVERMLRPSALFGYRHTAKQIFTRRGHRTVLGSYVQSTHRVSDNSRCPVLAPALANLFDVVARTAHELRLAVHADDGRRGLRHAVARLSRATGQLALLLVSSEDPPLQARALARRVRTRVPELAGYEVALDASQSNALLLATPVFQDGDVTIEEELLSFRHRLSPRSFFQVNPAAAEVLFTRALELCGEGTVCLEGYAGVGAMTFPLAKRFQRVIAVESAEASVVALKVGIERYGLTSVQPIQARVEDVLSDRLAEDRPELLVLDPPRAGVPHPVWSQLRGSSVQRVVLLSCDPKTLAAVVPALSEQGYELSHLVPVDQFPRTAHWEAITQFRKRPTIDPGSLE